MSASEQLAALVRRIADEGVGPGRNGVGDLISATPEIVAVVEAAEREHPEPHNYWAISEKGSSTHQCPVCAALTALEEKLKQ